ncbi:hypothetical protein [Rivularia sp. UHCC 0363]|uniref:hypothetical protein n=1 Tax=Rivularia sp. UHCC 0363 TaxID=3110244 RepID=UPI002B1F189D|nr:hypothetical protein [Rivularia sp. UHCC 0363]MEA5595710.1 hypothetical protein [Rivularia sp. UHCC 0363]
MADTIENNESLSADSTATNTNDSPDNPQSTNTITPNSLSDNDQFIPDSMADNNLITPDNRVGDSQNVENFSKIPISEFLKKYGIGRDPLYGRMRYLRITTYKVKNKAYLDAGQAAHMDALHEHIKATGRMDGYPIPEPSGPVTEEQKLSATPESTSEDDAENCSSLVIQNSSLKTQAQNSTLQPQEIETTFSSADIQQIKLEAQHRVKAKRMAVIQVAQAYEENPGKLPPEIQLEIEEAEMAAISTSLSHRPYYDPNVLAQLVIDTL